MATSDELRAELWQRNQVLAATQRAAREAALHGSASARHQLHKDWDPVDQWLLERSMSEPLEDDGVR